MRSRFTFFLMVVVALGVFVGAAWAQTTYQGDGNTKNDRWNDTNNWTLGSVPSGSVDVVISAANPWVTVWSASTPTHTGNITMEANTTIQLGWTTSYPSNWNAIGTAGSTTLTMGDGAFIKSRTSGSPSMPAIQLLGDAMISLGESTQTPADPTFAQPIDGPHAFTLQSNFSSTPVFSASNSFTHLIIKSITGRGGSPGKVTATVAGAFGAGDVTVTPYGEQGSTLEFDVSSVMSPTGTLHLNGGGPAGDGANMVQMDADNSIGGLTLQGYSYPTGTYGRVGTPATVSNEVSWMSGNSILTITNAPSDTSGPAVTFAGSGEGGRTGIVYSTEPVNYTITFDEPHTPALTSNDIENATATGMEIVSFTSVVEPAIGALSYEVVVKATGAGTLQLQIKAGTAIDDVFGNALVPVADNDTFIVDALPEVGSQLGVWVNWLNGGTNPATGSKWAAGDQYRLVFVTSSSMPATETNISVYNAFVQSAAAGSTTYTNLGDATWKAIGSSSNVSAKVNTGTDGAGGVPVILMDGITVMATDNADLWNGTAVLTAGPYAGDWAAPIFDENGVYRNTWVWAGSNTDGTTYTGQYLGTTENTKVRRGKTGPGENYASAHWILRADQTKTFSYAIYGLSEPLTLVSTAPAGTMIMVK